MALVIPTLPIGTPSIPEIQPEEMETIRRLLLERTGFHLCIYKEKCLMRRINIRIRATDSGNPKDYCDLLEKDEREIGRLLKTLTIHVSHFFRNPSVFALLRDTVFPELFSSRGGNAGELLLWSVGCSTGEEPYALAIILREYFASEMKRVPVRIIGTDINAGIIELAREGLYPPERVSELPTHLVERYFKEENGKLHISEKVREMVTFQREDIFSREFTRKCDMILCRNVMIYFERPWQEEMLTGFAESLPEGGFLILGKSETVVGEARRHFNLFSPVERIYRATKAGL